MLEVGITILLRLEGDQVTVLKPLVESLGAVVRPLLERLDFVDFLFQRNETPSPPRQSSTFDASALYLKQTKCRSCFAFFLSAASVIMPAYSNTPSPTARPNSLEMFFMIQK